MARFGISWLLKKRADEHSSRRVLRGTSPVETRSDARRRRRLGTSLVETLVSMTLLGVIFIPMLFLSSAFFLAQLAKSRQNVDVSVNAARFANQFMEELNLTQRLLPESNTTEIHFSYYDSIRQIPIKRGYRLSTSGSNRILEKLFYDSATESWTAQSPYGSAAADQVLLPGTAAFDYCNSDTCGQSAKNAVYVRLSGWEFMPAKNTARKVEFPDLDIYLSAGASAGGVMLANAPQELYSFAKASSFGSGANLNLVNLNPTGRMFNYTYIQAGDSGTLSTIVSAGSDPGYQGNISASPIDGRVYFGQSNGSRYWTWHTTTGLSTIGSTFGTGPGAYHANAVSPADGRIYFSASDGAVYTWQAGTGAGTGLSTIVPSSAGLNYPGYDDAMKTGPDGRVYFGTFGDNFFTWRSDTGLSTIATGLGEPGAYGSMGVSQIDGRVFFGQKTAGYDDFFTYHPSTGLTTLVTGGGISIGFDHSVAVSPLDGRVYFAEDSASSEFWSWHATSGLSTIVTGANLPGDNNGIKVASDGRVYFGESGAASGAKFWTWKAGTGAGTGLSTIFSNGSRPGASGSIAISPVDGRVFVGSDSGTGNFLTWKDNGTGAGVLTTIATGLPSPGAAAHVAVSPVDGRVVWSGRATGPVLTWHTDSGLSTIQTSIVPGSFFDNYDPQHIVSQDGRFYWGLDNATSYYWAWKESDGLSTIISGSSWIGIHGSAITSPVDNRVYVGSGSSGFWTWMAVTPSTTINRVTSVGGKTNQVLVVTPPTEYLNYTASYQDIDGELYLSDATTKKIDRYAYASSSFVRKTQFSWATSTGAVGAIAVDQGGTGIALLDTANKQIDLYANRKVTGSPTASSQLSLAATTTPTGLAVSGRTGNYLVLDSAQQGSNPNKYVRLFVYNSGGTQVTGSPWKIYLSPGAASGYGLSVDATGESAFKLQYDDEKNILYLIAPTVGRVYALMLPEAF